MSSGKISVNALRVTDFGLWSVVDGCAEQRYIAIHLSYDMPSSFIKGVFEYVEDYLDLALIRRIRPAMGRGRRVSQS